jgi:FtsP/CotA-like multicopper oxidase with cupredoxin domain
MVRINAMAQHIFRPSRRAVLAGLSASTLSAAAAPAAEERRSLALRARPGALAVRAGEPDTPIWSLTGADLVFKQGERADIAVGNELPMPVVLDWRGVDGAQAAEPLITRSPVAQGGSDGFTLPLRHAGTFLCDLVTVGEGAAQPARGLPLVVAEREPVAVDSDTVLLIEDWRFGADGAVMTAGTDPKGARAAIFTVNGKSKWEVRLRVNERLRIRLINATQRAVIALRIEDYDCVVMALDGQPAEPFLARGGLVLAPGARSDVFIDAKEKSPGATSWILLHDGNEARPVGRLIISDDPPIRAGVLPPPQPLPSNGLPARLDLKGALRSELLLGGSQSEWIAPARFAVSTSPAFRIKVGRTAVLALTNRSEITTVFHLHGHHFRLLDRLDDGWKPFWLDTLAIEPGQTQRIAFAAEFAGRWLMESIAADWAAPRLVRWYSVE